MGRSAWLAAALRIVLFAGPVTAYAQVATSCADCPTVAGELTIRNDTGSTINYSIRWGNEPWHKIELHTGQVETHSHPLDGQRKAPAPLIRADADMTPGRTDFRERELDFGAVEHRGFPRPGRVGEPVHYAFFIDHSRVLGLARQPR